MNVRAPAYAGAATLAVTVQVTRVELILLSAPKVCRKKLSAFWTKFSGLRL